MSTNGKEGGQLRRGFKPREVEEIIDFYFHRPLASLLVRLLLPLPITPDQVTILSAIVGLISGAVMALAIWWSVWWFAAGSAVLLLCILLDCADGQLARIRNQMTPVGRILDGTMDVAAPLSVFHAFAFFLLSRGLPFVYIWPIGLAAACSLVLHTSQYDGVKNLYLHCARPDFSLGGKTLLTVGDIEQWKREFAAQHDWFRVILMKIWIGWTRSQAKTLEAWRQDLSPRNDDEREEYRRMYRGTMRAWSWLGLGTHMFLLVLGSLLTPLWANTVWVVWGIMLGPLNLLHAILVWRRGRLERRWGARLVELRAAAEATGG
jgi:thiosulfate reductase cytochrome b subunit